MDTASTHTPAPRRAVFEDGFGKRHHAVGPGGEPLEILEFRDELAATSSFEFALRERVSALIGFQNTGFARIRSVQRLGQNASKLVVISDRVPGARLSTVLAVAKQQLLPLEVNAALCLLRQLVPAMATLHEKMPTFGHGALSPERIIITPNARLVVVDHMLSGAVEELRYSHSGYWRELCIPLPPAAQPTFDHRADVMQIGMVTLALILGRPIEIDEYPDQVAALAEGAWGLTATGGVEPLPAELRTWLSRTLQLDARQSFASAVEAWSDLERALGTSDYVASFGALKSFMAEYATCAPSGAVVARATASQFAAVAPAPAVTVVAAPARVATAAGPPVAAVAEIESPTVLAAPAGPIIVPGQTPPRAQPPSPPARSASAPVAASTPVTRVPAAIWSTPQPVSAAAAPPVSPAPAAIQAPPPRPSAPIPAPAAAPAPVAPTAEKWSTPAAPSVSATPWAQADAVKKNEAPWWRQRWVAAAAVLLVLVSGGTLVGRWYLPSAAAEAPGTLIVSTEPAGVPVVVDGQPRGVTPLKLELAAGAHELRLATDGDPRVIPLTITAGGTVSQSFELPKVGPDTGQLMVRTEPSGARVVVDGTARGVAPLTFEGLTPGIHSVVLANDVSSVTHEVTVEAGATASLVVPMSTTPQGVPVSGWIAVSAPSEVQVYEDNRLLGTSRSDRIMVSAGRHEFEIVNEALGYRVARTVTVSPGQVSPLRLEWPKGSMALNAQPWADVWIDGERVGETPIGSVSVSIGPHEVVFRHPDLGEQVVRATVMAGESTRVSVDMRKQ